MSTVAPSHLIGSSFLQVTSLTGTLTTSPSASEMVLSYTLLNKKKYAFRLNKVVQWK